jgi:hypothetical protein
MSRKIRSISCLFDNWSLNETESLNVPTRLREEDFVTNSSRSLQLLFLAQIKHFIIANLVNIIKSIIKSNFFKKSKCEKVLF